MEFPIYRKYPNNKSFFRINSNMSFDEIKVTGHLVEWYSFVAKIHPDRLFIQDMLAMENGHWVESNAQEFEEQLKRLPR